MHSDSHIAGDLEVQGGTVVCCGDNDKSWVGECGIPRPCICISAYQRLPKELTGHIEDVRFAMAQCKALEQCLINHENEHVKRMLDGTGGGTCEQANFGIIDGCCYPPQLHPQVIGLEECDLRKKHIECIREFLKTEPMATRCHFYGSLWISALEKETEDCPE